jgi:ABC-2 type transport system permease protein
MTVAPATATDPTGAPGAPPPSRRAGWTAFRALLMRDLTVLDKDLKEFLPNTLIQPTLAAFMFAFVFPKIGQGIGGSGNVGRFSTVLLGGLVAQSIAFQGLFRVALPLARELDITNELEDRVLAPAPISVIALEKIVAGALQSLFAGLIVFPIAAFLPSTPIYLRAHWDTLVPVTVLSCYASAALGLTIGTYLAARLLPILVGFIALPLGFFGAIFYTWDALTPIGWLKVLVLINPLVYMSEGFRASLSTGVVHMPLPAIYGALVGSCVLFTVLGIRGFKRRVLA